MKIKILASLLFLSFSSLSYSRLTTLETIHRGINSIYKDEACNGLLRDLREEDFYSQRVSDSLVNIPSLGSSGKDYYHYTNSQIFWDLIENKDFESILSYFKTQAFGVAGQGLYLAGGSTSSAHYGNFQVKMEMKDSAKIFRLKDYDLLYNERLIFEDKFKISDCGPGLIEMIILESCGTDIYEYAVAPRDASDSWFVLVNEEAIESAAVKKKEDINL